MKPLIGPIALACVLFSSVEAQTLSFPEILGEKLTPLWAQEYIGSDLIRAELASKKTTSIDLGVIDLGFEEEHITLSPGFEDISVPFQRNGNRRMRANHGTSIVNLLTGPENYRVTDHALLTKLSAAYFPGSYRHMYRQYEEMKRFPRVVSNSVGWRQSPQIVEAISDFDKQGTLWFLAAGNSFPEKVDPIEKESQALLIGSFAPSGLTSYEAQNDQSLLVLAPADTELLTINGYGEEHRFGASSGATPLVAGTVINLLALMPELTKEQIKTIIKKTAFPSVENKLGFKNLPGLLNGYKAFKVVERLKTMCSSDEGCRERELKTRELFDFQSTDQQREKTNCFAFTQALESDSGDEVLEELRRLSFLGSQFHQIETACAYRALGFSKNAEYFDYLANVTLDLPMMEAQAKKAHNEAIYQISYYRYGPFYSADYLKHLKSSPMRESHQKMLMEIKKEDITVNSRNGH